MFGIALVTVTIPHRLCGIPWRILERFWREISTLTKLLWDCSRAPFFSMDRSRNRCSTTGINLTLVDSVLRKFKVWQYAGHGHGAVVGWGSSTWRQRPADYQKLRCARCRNTRLIDLWRHIEVVDHYQLRVRESDDDRNSINNLSSDTHFNITRDHTQRLVQSCHSTLSHRANWRSLFAIRLK